VQLLDQRQDSLWKGRINQVLNQVDQAWNGIHFATAKLLDGKGNTTTQPRSRLSATFGKN